MSFKETSEICGNLKKINFILRKDENFKSYSSRLMTMVSLLDCKQFIINFYSSLHLPLPSAYIVSKQILIRWVSFSEDLWNSTYMSTTDGKSMCRLLKCIGYSSKTEMKSLTLNWDKYISVLYQFKNRNTWPTLRTVNWHLFIFLWKYPKINFRIILPKLTINVFIL